jgi:hypothetical protein
MPCADCPPNAAPESGARTARRPRVSQRRTRVAPPSKASRSAMKRQPTAAGRPCSSRPARLLRPKSVRIPIGWLSAAARLPGKSLHTGVALWCEAGSAASNKIPLSNVYSLDFGVDRNGKYGALAWLERAGLVTVDRKLGRSPLVTIQRAPVKPLESPADASPGG